MIQAPDGYYFRDLVEDDMPQLVEVSHLYLSCIPAVKTVVDHQSLHLEYCCSMEEQP